ncbi:MAG: TFIIB-type zinc ribbon-containing protein [Eubacteriales bacterium]|nr:TFIIB-type zinc ribbon-containing protein [Eubacteriales bacterium]
MEAISYKCPNCGADLKFDPSTQKYTCEYCASSFDEAQLEQANPNAAKKAEASAENQQKEAFEALVYSCPSCGAEIVADETTAATFCYYCHNPVVLQGKLTGEYAPDQIIPFAIDRKKAVDSFLAYVKKKKFVPKGFFNKDQIEKISGVYFPFWVYSCETDYAMQGDASMIRVHTHGDEEITETSVFHVERQATIDFDQFLKNALESQNRRLVEAVQPFEVEKARPFAMGYLSGFQAQKRNIEKAAAAPEFRKEAEEHAKQMVNITLSQYQRVQTTQEKSAVRNEHWKYLLLPAWVVTYRGGDGETYYYAMNGQTGKVAGILPISRGRMLQFFASIAIPLFVIFLIVGYMI